MNSDNCSLGAGALMPPRGPRNPSIWLDPLSTTKYQTKYRYTLPRGSVYGDLVRDLVGLSESKDLYGFRAAPAARARGTANGGNQVGGYNGT